jgi:hypothetical protein
VKARWALAALAVSLPLQAFFQGVDLRNAECGATARGSYACDFEYYLHKSVELHPARPSTDYQFAVGAGGSYSIWGEVEGQKYHVGGTGAGSQWDALSRQAGNAAVTLQFYQPFMPGVFESARGEALRPTFNANEALYANYVQKVEKLASALQEGETKYLSEVSAPAIEGYRKSLAQLKAVVESQLDALTLPLVAATSNPSPVERSRVPGVATPLSLAIGRAENSPTPIEKWEALEPLWTANQSGATKLLGAADATAAETTYRKYFNAQGLPNENLVSKESAALGHQMGAGLHSLPGTITGTEIRRQLVRGLVAYDSSPAQELRAQSLGGIALAVGADQAVAAGENGSARELLKQSAQILDTVLGFVPIASSVNDATQIVFGMVTGQDYAGNPMTHADFGLRGVGILLGLLPAKAVFQFGKKVLGKVFHSGASTIRRYSLGERVAVNIAKEKELAKEVAEAVGHYADESLDVLERFKPRRNAEHVLDILESEPGLKERIVRELVEIESLPGPAFFKDGFLDHYLRHVVKDKNLRALGVRTPKDYVEAAQKLIRNSAAEHFTRIDGRDIHFLESTGEFAVHQGDQIATYYVVAKDAAAYWQSQLRQVIKK